MTTLEEFLAKPIVTNITEKITIERLGEFEVKPMSNTQLASYRARAKVKRGKEIVMDEGKLNMLIITGQLVSPNFNDASFLAQANCNTAQEFIETRFKAGEIVKLADKITEISGFGEDINDKIDEAKN